MCTRKNMLNRLSSMRHHHIIQQCLKWLYICSILLLICAQNSQKHGINIFIFLRFSMHQCRRQHPLNFASGISSSANQPPLSGKIMTYTSNKYISLCILFITRNSKVVYLESFEYEHIYPVGSTTKKNCIYTFKSMPDLRINIIFCFSHQRATIFYET